MRFQKEVLGALPLCYCVAPLIYRGRQHFLVASEKEYACWLLDESGKRLEVVWEKPGGVMSMVQVPDSDGVFLATHRFFSPNDSKEASIVLVSPPKAAGESWGVKTLASLPHVHRFDILTSGENQYLFACTLCSGRDYKDDWSYPGKVYAALLPKDLDKAPIEELPLTVLKDNMLKNHGYCRSKEDGRMAGVVTCESGAYRFIPPAKPGEAWGIEQLLDTPLSDIALVDFDGDGEEELVCFSPFHGEELKVYKKTGGSYIPIYTHPEPLPFLHAILGGELLGEPAAVIGYRRGNKALCCLRWSEKDGFTIEVVDQDKGPANVLHHRCTYGGEFVIAANRESDEIALYRVQKESEGTDHA